MEEGAFTEANLGYLEEFTSGNQEMIKEIVALFLKQTPQDMEALNQFVETQNWEQTKAMTHHIKPTLTYVGAESLKETLQTFEKMVYSLEDLESISLFFEAMEKRFKVLYQDLELYLAQNHSQA